MTCSSVKGHLTRKSTVFSPSGNKYGTQSLLHDQMMSHYRRVEKAKSTIDNKPPKSTKTFIKAHAKRMYLQKQKQWEIDLETRCNSVMLQSEESTGNFLPRPASAFGDYGISRYDFKLTNRRNSTPNAFQSSRMESLDFSSLNLDDNLNQSFVLRRSSTPISYRQASKTDVRSLRTPRHKVEMYSPDPEKTILKGSVYNTSHSIILASKWNPGNPNGTNNSSGVNRAKDSVEFNTGDDVLTTDLQRGSSLSLFGPDYKRLDKQDKLIAEEQAYLKFIEDVTNDVLARGIFSDRVLNQVFESHIERRKNQLNEKYMRELIEELKADLNVADVTVGH